MSVPHDFCLYDLGGFRDENVIELRQRDAERHLAAKRILQTPLRKKTLHFRTLVVPRESFSKGRSKKPGEWFRDRMIRSIEITRDNQR